jgi:hypothetical protein
LKEFFIFELSSRRRRPAQDIKPPPPTSEKKFKISSRRRRSNHRLTPLIMSSRIFVKKFDKQILISSSFIDQQYTLNK